MLTIHHLVFHPHDVVGQRGDLLGGEADTYDQVQRVLAGDGVVHQVFELRLVGGLTIDEGLAGAGNDCPLNQGLLVQAVAQAFGAVVKIVTEAGQQVVRTHELLEAGNCRTGFDIAVGKVIKHEGQKVTIIYVQELSRFGISQTLLNHLTSFLPLTDTLETLTDVSSVHFKNL
jgi:hypothetical protein